MTQSYTSDNINVSQLLRKNSNLKLMASTEPENFERAYLELRGLDTIGPSYEGRIFFNNPVADENTPLTAAMGFAGSFFVFAHLGCGGDEGHCERSPGTREFDKRRPNNSRSVTISTPITEGLRHLLEQGEELRFTIVPVIMSANDRTDTDNPLKFDKYEISLRYKNFAGKTIKTQLLTPIEAQLESDTKSDAESASSSGRRASPSKEKSGTHRKPKKTKRAAKKPARKSVASSGKAAKTDLSGRKTPAFKANAKKTSAKKASSAAKVAAKTGKSAGAKTAARKAATAKPSAKKTATKRTATKASAKKSTSKTSAKKTAARKSSA